MLGPKSGEQSTAETHCRLSARAYTRQADGLAVKSSEFCSERNLGKLLRDRAELVCIFFLLPCCLGLKVKQKPLRFVHDFFSETWIFTHCACPVGQTGKGLRGERQNDLTEYLGSPGLWGSAIPSHHKDDFRTPGPSS